MQKDNKTEPNEIPPQKTRHVREGSLFNEILALKNNDIINEQVFEEGFHKINVLNNEMKNWGTQQRVSELDITLPESKENTLQKPLLMNNNDKNMLRPDENLRNLFKSKQMISIPHDEKKERKKTVEVNKNPYEEFFILVRILFIYISVEKLVYFFFVRFSWVKKTGQCAKLNSFHMNEIIEVNSFFLGYFYYFRST